jgi:spore coat polysaccharide biosynthesis protein SpsF (cytidylyltransferase family)
MEEIEKDEVFTDDIPIKFWKEYDDTDMLKREEKIKFIIDNIINVCDVIKDNPVLRQHAISTTLQSYFEDAMEYAYAKGKKEKNN